LKPKVYHPLLGLPVVWKVTESLDDRLRSLVTLATASHHTALHQDLYKNVDSQQMLEVSDRHHFEDLVLKLSDLIRISSFDASEFYDISCLKILHDAKYNFMPSSIEEGIELRERQLEFDPYNLNDLKHRLSFAILWFRESIEKKNTADFYDNLKNLAIGGLAAFGGAVILGGIFGSLFENGK
jgi:hypothetical protein